MVDGSGEYGEKIVEQIRQYENVQNMHGQLSGIFHYWQKKYFKPRFQSVCEADNHLHFYWKQFRERILKTDSRNLISFGCGDGQVEVGVANGLVKDGVDDFLFHCVEISPAQIERATANVSRAGLEDKFVFVEGDFNTWEPSSERYAGAMCHHALHHVQDLEHLILSIKNSLVPGGCFASIDVIGRNGHMRWPEALELIERIWRFLPDAKRYHNILKSLDREYVNRDCSTKGFEGIRAQDILPILSDNFKFEVFFAFGNLVDVFTSRGFGENYSLENERDIAFIDFVQYLNDLLIDLGHIKPTRMCAVMVAEDVEEPRFYKNWTPEFCIRKVT